MPRLPQLIMGIKTKYLFHWVLMGIKYINTDQVLWQNACHRVGTTKASLNFLSQKHLSLFFFFSSVGRHEGEGWGEVKNFLISFWPDEAASSS